MIQSHYNPNKSLKQHIDEVAKAAKAILAKHSNIVRSDNIENLLKYIIDFHDLGKAIPEFQKYIANPEMYKGRKLDKAHAPVSLLLWIAYAMNNEIDPETFLLVAIIVWKHHGDFPTFDDFYYHADEFDDFVYPFEKIDLDINPDFEPDEIDIQDSFDDDFLTNNYDLKKAAELRIKGQLLFSILIEADRTYLALSKDSLKLKLEVEDLVTIHKNIVSDYLTLKSHNSNQNARLNNERTEIRNEIIKNSTGNSNIESVTLPTGLGKTMIAAEWALKHRNNQHRKVIIVLPFLSIIDQTVKEYKNLLSNFDSESLILEAHSIAERKYRKDDIGDAESEALNKFNNAIDFLTDTWNSDFIITTFDQFIYSLLSSKNSHILRFHNLTDALIIIDEIQALPTPLWQPLSFALEVIAKKLNSKILIMTATQPDFLNTKELVPNIKKIFAKQNRYKLVLKYKEPINIADFIKECIERIERENWNTKRVLIILNTRKSARAILDYLEKYIDSKIYFLSADVVPKERLDNIEKIKKNKPCLVIATQCIEAGVDIDMDFVIRDMAPLDSIIQCAGRCNRNGLKPQGNIEIISLKNKNNKLYTSFVYDQTLLEKTKILLSQYTQIQENEIFTIITKYFSLLKECKDIGLINTEKWAYWKEELDLKKLLRGDNKKYDFIVASMDEDLKDDLLNALETEDRWERKRKVRFLKGRIAKLTISVWANNNIVPEEIAEQIGCFYLLKDEFYTKGKGLELKSLDEINASIFI